MLLSTLSQAGMQIFLRTVPGGMHPFQMAFFRNFFGVLLLLGWYLPQGKSVLKTTRIKGHLLRGLLNVVAMLMFFTAVLQTPLAQVAALSFTAPLFASLLAIPLLKERFRPRRMVVIVVGVLGMLLILRPGLEVVGTGPILVVVASIFWGMALLVIKTLSSSDSPATITVYMGIFMAPLALVAALPVWVQPTLLQLLWMVMVAVLGTMSQMTLVQSFRLAEASAVLPVDFFKLIWGAVLGHLLFAEVPDSFTWIGGVVIFSSTTYLALRESR